MRRAAATPVARNAGDILPAPALLTCPACGALARPFPPYPVAVALGVAQVGHCVRVYRCGAFFSLPEHRYCGEAS